MRPLKIALLSRWYAEEHRRSGGTGTVQQLAEAVAALGHEVVVLSQSKSVLALEKAQPGEFGALETWLTSREKRRGGWTGLRDRWEKRRFGHRKLCSDALDLRDFLAARGPFDVLWAQCEEPDGLVAACAAGMGVALPPTLTQIYALRYRFERLKPIFRDRTSLGAAFVHATRIIANSELVAANLEAYANERQSASQLWSKTHVVYHNLQTTFLRAAKSTGPEPEPGRVLFLGAINEKKGAYPFLQATKMVRTPGATFVVVGGETEKHWRYKYPWEKLLKERQRYIHLLGKISSDETIAQIRRASVIVLPSLFDEFSRALVEVLVLGRPVVTTELVGAAPFVSAAQAGLIVSSANPFTLARAIDKILVDPATYTLNARAVAPRLAHELSPHAIALQIARHLSEISL